MKVALIGGGIGGLTAALYLHREGIDCRVYEATPEYKPVGVGINLFSHAIKRLSDLGLGSQLAAVGLEPQEFCFFNQYGQLIYDEPCGRHAGYDVPHLSFHRADLHTVLLAAVHERLGADAVVMGHKFKRVEQDDRGVTLHFEDTRTGQALPAEAATIAIGCDGIHSGVRKQFYPDEGLPTFGGINMWRGITRQKPVLTGASVVRAGPLKTGKMVIYPIRNYPDGTQLINWVAEVQLEVRALSDWSKAGRLEDFIHYFKDWHFDWLDVPEMLRNAELILEYPMVDRDPVPRWTFGRVTLLGDAAHPMYPRGGNGAAQAIIDASVLAPMLKTSSGDPVKALQQYEGERLEKTAQIVRTNRSQPPDFIIETVNRLTEGKPFARIGDVISREELTAISERYKQVTGGTVSAVNRQ
ncbi:MAG: flavin-dependent oxidoreductase [Pseudomonadota bacterium]